MIFFPLYISIFLRYPLKKEYIKGIKIILISITVSWFTQFVNTIILISVFLL